MHFLFIAEFFPDCKNPVFSGGVEARCFYVITRIAQHHMVTVLSRRKKGEQAKETNGNLTIIRYGSPVSSFTATVGSIVTRLFYVIWCIRRGLSIKADIVEGSNYVTFVPAFALGLIKDIPKIAYYPDVLLGQWITQFGLVLGSIGEIAERFFVILPWNHIITTSPPPKDRLVKAGVKESIVTYFRLGVSLTEWVKTRALVKKQPQKLVIVSRLVGYKRVDWAVRLVDALKHDFPDIRLTIIGKGPEEERLKKLVKESSLGSKITFLSNIDDSKVRAEVVSAVLLVHPSLIEGYGMVLAEAASAGTPFVAADIPTSVDLVKEFRSGITFNKDNFGDFVHTVKQLLLDKDRSSRMKEAGIKNTYDLDWQNVADGVVDLYSGIVKDYRRQYKPEFG